MFYALQQCSRVWGFRVTEFNAKHTYTENNSKSIEIYIRGIFKPKGRGGWGGGEFNFLFAGHSL